MFVDLHIGTLSTDRAFSQTIPSFEIALGVERECLCTELEYGSTQPLQCLTTHVSNVLWSCCEICLWRVYGRVSVLTGLYRG